MLPLASPRLASSLARPISSPLSVSFWPAMKRSLLGFVAAHPAFSPSPPLRKKRDERERERGRKEASIAYNRHARDPWKIRHDARLILRGREPFRFLLFSACLFSPRLFSYRSFQCRRESRRSNPRSSSPSPFSPKTKEKEKGTNSNSAGKWHTVERFHG